MFSATPTQTTEETVTLLFERLKREPSLRAWVLSSPTLSLATFGLTMDDNELVSLLDEIASMDSGPLPVTAADIMSASPITTHPRATVHEAARLLSDNRISGMPVTDDDGRLEGILSEFDLIAREGTTVGDVMTRDVVSVRESATIAHVRAILVSRRLKRVPVLNADGRLSGLISRADLVRELAYRWRCTHCLLEMRARHRPDRCSRCGATEGFVPSAPPPVLATCPTCGHPLNDPA